MTTNLKKCLGVPHTVLLCDTFRTETSGARGPYIGKTTESVGVLVQVLLMIVFGIIEFLNWQYFRRDLSFSDFLQFLLEGLFRSIGQFLLLIVVIVDAGTILCSDVDALPHSSGWVVVFPEYCQQFFIRSLLWIVDDADHFCMTRQTGAQFGICRIWCRTSAVANLCKFTAYT